MEYVPTFAIYASETAQAPRVAGFQSSTKAVEAAEGNGYKKFVIRRSFQSCGHEYLRGQIVYTQR